VFGPREWHRREGIGANLSAFGSQPKGRKKIAHRFDGVKCAQRRTSPVRDGRTEQA
jgi:hypothetical protein